MKFRVFFLVVFLVFSTSHTYAFWIWTPETNKWINPKYAVKDTPQEQLAYALESYEAKDYTKALSELNKLIKNYPKAREAAEAQFYIAQIHEKEGELYKAFKAYQVVIDKYPFSERSAEIVEIQYTIGERMLEGKGKKNRIVAVVAGSDYDVVDLFRTVIKNAPYGQYAAASQYKIGLYLQEKGLYQEAREEFDKVVNDYSDSKWVKAARNQIALVDAQRSSDAAYDQNITQAAVEEFKDFVGLYPGVELSREAKGQIGKLREKEAENNFLIAQFYEKQKKYRASRIYYKTVVEEYSQTSWAVKALEKIREFDLKDREK